MTAAASPLRQFPCSQCGAPVAWDPAAGAQRCSTCGTSIEPPSNVARIEELDYQEWSRRVAGEAPEVERLVVHCDGCGGETSFADNVVAGSCAFCGSAIAAHTRSRRLIRPASLLPFSIPRPQALAAFEKWVRSRWFAPSALKRLARAETQRLRGIYLPFWTYDAEATTEYTGQRGDDYTVSESYTTVENGRTVTKVRQVTRTRWRHAAGTVHDSFDDVLVAGSESVPREIVAKLEPWDLGALVPFADEYLAGFECESYQVSLDEGMARAGEVMGPVIEQTIRADIGGDHQRIHSVHTDYTDVRFKHVLLPLWICSYRYHDKVYRFVVNARTGEVQGERPWSWIKITALVLLVAAIVALVVYLNR